jgi:invasion protein IalB
MAAGVTWFREDCRMKLAFQILIALAAMIGLATGPSGAATKIQKTFGGWQVECNETDQGEKTCAVFIAFIHSQNKAVILNWTIGRAEKADETKLIVRTLTGIDVSQGISVQFEGSEPIVIPFKICMPQFCLAEVPFSDNWLQALKGAKKFTVTYKAANSGDVKQEVDLQGFSEAYDYYASQLKG